VTDTLYGGPCVAGCMHFHGGEARHHRDCGHYPQSLTKVNSDRVEALLADLEEAKKALLEIHRIVPLHPAGDIALATLKKIKERDRG
jgi:hypothetical protein